VCLLQKNIATTIYNVGHGLSNICGTVRWALPFIDKYNKKTIKLEPLTSVHTSWLATHGQIMAQVTWLVMRVGSCFMLFYSRINLGNSRKQWKQDSSANTVLLLLFTTIITSSVSVSIYTIQCLRQQRKPQILQSSYSTLELPPVAPPDAVDCAVPRLSGWPAAGSDAAAVLSVESDSSSRWRYRKHTPNHLPVLKQLYSTSNSIWTYDVNTLLSSALCDGGH